MIVTSCHSGVHVCQSSGVHVRQYSSVHVRSYLGLSTCGSYFLGLLGFVNVNGLPRTWLYMMLTFLGAGVSAHMDVGDSYGLVERHDECAHGR